MLCRASAQAVEVQCADQKNGYKGENLTLRPTGHATLCPVRAMVRRLHDLKQHGCNAITSYNKYFDGGLREQRKKGKYKR